MTETILPDAVSGHWADRLAPPFARPYLRLARIERPIGWWLLLLPCWWSTALAAQYAGKPYPDPLHLLLFFIGAIAMRGAGCTYNDLVDRDLDAKVERTRNRPIPAGDVSPRNALLFIVLLCSIGLLVLLQFNTITIILGFASLGIVVLYPLMKRVFWVPQLVLGFAFSWGALLGWTGTVGALGLAPVALYLGAIAWTVGYDTIYALQDIEDDEVAGIKSSARFFGSRVGLAVGLCYLFTVAGFAVALGLSGAGWVSFFGLAGFGLHCLWQVATLDPKDGVRSLRLFRSNRDAGLILFAALALDCYIA